MRAAVLLAIVAPIACSRAPAPADVRPRASLDSIVLERTRCFGGCPAYRLRIDGSAVVVFESRNPGDSGTVSRDTVEAWVPDSLAAHLVRVGFRNLPDQIAGSALCPEPVTDLPTITVAMFGQHTKRVTYDTGCFLRFDFSTTFTVAPSLVALRQFAVRMDTLTGAHQWIRPARRR
jgi:hypothetical protein